jgi:flagellar biosynthesis chaperone FliJ
MSTRKHDADRGLHAVGRVREVRERDSRIGLVQALTSAQQREREATELQSALDGTPSFTEGTSAQFIVSRQLLSGMAVRVRIAQDQARHSRMVADQAREHWQTDKTRLRAVEFLLEKRAAERRAEIARHEARELDDVAGRMWIRRRVEAGDPA